jgi:hypothetical protein
MVIIISGVKRIIVYEEAYGYTYLRILVGLFFLWVAGSLLVFIIKIIRKKSISWLISYSLCLALIFLMLVSAFSIDNFIARKNIDRYLQDDKELDMDYLGSLSTDAYPEIQRLYIEARDEKIRTLAERLLLRHRETAKENLQHWASWNLSLFNADKK